MLDCSDGGTFGAEGVALLVARVFNGTGKKGGRPAGCEARIGRERHCNTSRSLHHARIRKMHFHTFFAESHQGYIMNTYMNHFTSPEVAWAGAAAKAQISRVGSKRMLFAVEESRSDESPAPLAAEKPLFSTPGGSFRAAGPARRGGGRPAGLHRALRGRSVPVPSAVPAPQRGGAGRRGREPPSPAFLLLPDFFPNLRPSYLTQLFSHDKFFVIETIPVCDSKTVS